MTLYWAGGELDAFALGSAPTGIEHTTGTYFNSTYARCSVYLNSSNNGEYFATLPWGSNLTNVWCHFHYAANSSPSNGNILFEFVNGSGQVVFKITTATSATAIQAAYWNGSTFTNIGTAPLVDLGIASDWDIHLVCGASGVVEVVLNGNLIASGTFSDTDCDNVASARFHNVITVGSTANTSHYSECIIADVPTVNWHLFTRPPTGNGANTTWTGAFGDVDETVLTDADFISGVANGDIETYTGAAATLTGFEVKGVIVSARTKRDNAGPQNLQFALRESSTNYFSANVTALVTSFSARQAIWELDPATAAAWTTAAAGSASLEFGVKAIT